MLLQASLDIGWGNSSGLNGCGSHSIDIEEGKASDLSLEMGNVIFTDRNHTGLFYCTTRSNTQWQRLLFHL